MVGGGGVVGRSERRDDLALKARANGRVCTDETVVEDLRYVGGFDLFLAAPVYSATVEVTVDGIAFVPPDVTINAGDSVHWTEIAPFHNVAEVDDAAAMSWNGGFRSGGMGAVSEFTQTFNTPGMYFYICEPHVFAGMRGSIMVNAAPPAPTLTAWGTVAMVGLVLASGGVVLYRRRQFAFAVMR
jgi:plastocyanin